MSKPILLLVDGSSFLYRAYHALPDLRGPAGQPTGAVHGFVAMMKKLRDDEGATFAACVFDAKGKTFRDDWYPEYKAQRPSMPDDLRAQIEPIHEVVKILGWPVLEVPGIEADDAIGTLACIGRAAGYRVVIATGDKDMAQLVNEDVSLVNTMAKPIERLDSAAVTAKFGVPPERIIDYLTLMGDTVDNVPGVEKVGPKTAAKWIGEYGSLDGVIASADQVKGVAGENLRKALDWLPMGRKLVTIKCDCSLDEHLQGLPSLDALAFKEVDKPALIDFFTREGFKTLLKEAMGGAAAPAAAAAAPKAAAAPQSPGLFDDEPVQPRADIASDYTTILDWPTFDAWLAKVQAAELTAVDTETDSLEPMLAKIVGISFSVKAGEAAYIPLTHSGPDAPAQLPIDEVLAKLKPWLEDASKKKLGQNLKYDWHVFANHGIALNGVVHDTMLQSYVLEAHKTHGLGALGERYLGRAGVSYEDLCGKGVNQIPFAQVEVAKAAHYSAEDSDMCMQVHEILWPRIEAEAGLKFIYELEVKTSELLARIERNGVLIDAGRLNAQSHELAQRMIAIEQEAYAIAGQPFNMGSPKQLGEILFDKLGLPTIKKTATGARSTDEEVLAKLAEDYPLPAKILEYRGLAKLKSTYTDKLPQQINASTGRVHTTYSQAVAVTGRLASTDPNLQNIPIRTPEGRRVREAFVAAPGHVIASADYSQIELRLMAHISEDPGMLNAFGEGQDVHRATASEVFGTPLAEVSAEQRRYAKTINFGLIYGMGAFGLASSLGIEQKAAKDYIDRYFTRFAGVRDYMERTKEFARANGYVQTLFGRRIYLPEINGGNGPRKAGAERQAINAPMQGTAADLIKLAMAAVQAELDRAGKATRIVMQVHDELVFEVPEAELDWVKAEIPRLMATAASFKVPLLAEVGVGANWDEAH